MLIGNEGSLNRWAEHWGILSRDLDHGVWAAAVLHADGTG
jgi:hypothetical protein